MSALSRDIEYYTVLPSSPLMLIDTEAGKVH